MHILGASSATSMGPTYVMVKESSCPLILGFSFDYLDRLFFLLFSPLKMEEKITKTISLIFLLIHQLDKRVN